MHTITSLDALEALYQPAPTEASTVKELDRLIPEYRRYIELSPFVALATNGPEGLDCSPRGDAPGFVRVLDERTLALPDRKGNHRIDSLRNIVRNPQVALLFLIPGSGTTFRVNGRAAITDDAALRASFAVDGHLPRTVLLIHIEQTYFQCARAIVRARLWDAAHHVPPGEVPTPGQVLERLSGARIDGARYDADWPARAAASLW
ncbi:MAG: pyridoxamine 5'-phosphate oxidase family protein [Proteobacteria bacterium]|nr:pyridoxamine 5'-phosphate oxidase family protein [Pseudomonadota bacterium]